MSSAQSTASSRSASVSSTEKEKVTAVSTSISRNTSRDNAVQINGHVAGKIYNLNFKNLIVNCPCRLASKIASHQKETLEPPGNASKTPTPREKPKVSIVEITDGDSELPTPSPQNLTLRSSSSGEFEIARAIFRPNVRENFISHRIVRRLKLKSYFDSSVKTVVSRGSAIISTGEFVDLACSSEKGTDDCPYRFYIVKHSPSFREEQASSGGPIRSRT